MPPVSTLSSGLGLWDRTHKSKLSFSSSRRYGSHQLAAREFLMSNAPLARMHGPQEVQYFADKIKAALDTGVKLDIEIEVQDLQEIC
eukprot:m.4358 g.4358  ORF g.4358 m.4358 type:complete len:87 (-) comp3039_c0_seq1:751-1011(-)